MSILSFIRPAVQQMDPYVPVAARPEQGLRLDLGENLWAPPLDFSAGPYLASYPDPYAMKLRQELARYCGVQPEQVLIGNGSDELIDLCCRAFLESGSTLVDFPPTFGMYRVCAQIQGATVVTVPRDSIYRLDIQKAVEALKKAQCAFLATPNNPTGTRTSLSQLEELLEVGVPLIVDEAYMEFCGVTAVPLLARYDNLIILRTFSKWAGLAGARLGYMIAAPSCIEMIEKIKPPYNVNAIAQEAGVMVMKNLTQYQEAVTLLLKGKTAFLAACAKIPRLQCVPSDASCILVNIVGADAECVAKELAKRGIYVRCIQNQWIPNALRVSLAPPEQMIRCARALSRVLQMENGRLQERIL